MGETLIINRDECAKVLSIEGCMPAMAEALKAVSLGQVKMLQRSMIAHDSGNTLANMPASLMSENVTGAKVIIFPGAKTAKEKTNQGIIPLFDIESGALLAIVDAELITVIRTAATSAVASELLAKEDAASLAILGSGKQGKAHVKAMISVRDIKTVYMWDIFMAASVNACEELAKEYPKVEFIPCATAKAAVENSDIICTTTPAKSTEPILKGEWLREGAHINAVGACSGSSREIDGIAVSVADIFVDWAQAAGRDAGDLIIPYANGELKGKAEITEIGQVLLGKAAGRQSDKAITIFESVGISVEDIAAANMIYKAAKAQGIGTYITI
ncbi:MAG: ornithine cyclodeaminase family protein [Oscillospiraceae bacterium]